MARRVNYQPDWTKPCGHYGGELKEIPTPFVRRFPGPIKRLVKINMYSYEGVSPGAYHWWVDVTEENNPIWNPAAKEYPSNKPDPRWQEPWEDPDGKGRRISGHLNTKEEAVRWAEVVCVENFSPETHQFVMADNDRVFFPVRFGKKLKKPRQASLSTGGWLSMRRKS